MKAFFYEIVDSTNDVARQLLADGKITGDAYVFAREQRRGRGTHARTWASPRDAGIYLSVVQLELGAAAKDSTVFTQSAGVACAETLAEIAGVRIQLKPINDLYARGLKLGGILTEAIVERSRITALITGIGINVFRAPRDLPPDGPQPICLEDLMDPSAIVRLDVTGLVERLAANVCRWNRLVVEEGPSGVKEFWWGFATGEATTAEPENL